MKPRLIADEIGEVRPSPRKERERWLIERRNMTEIIGCNSRWARNLNGLKIIDAQRLLGYASAGSVSKLEGGSSDVSNSDKLATAKEPPSVLDLVYICKAYGVSADFILGLSPYPEPETKERVMAQVQMSTESTVRRCIKELTEVVLYSNMTGLDYKVRLDNYSLEMSELIEVVMKFISKNKDSEEWQDMVMGNNLIAQAEKAFKSHNDMARAVRADQEAKQLLADEQARKAGNKYPLLDEVL